MFKINLPCLLCLFVCFYATSSRRSGCSSLVLPSRLLLPLKHCCYGCDVYCTYKPEFIFWLSWISSIEYKPWRQQQSIDQLTAGVAQTAKKRSSTAEDSQGEVENATFTTHNRINNHETSATAATKPKENFATVVTEYYFYSDFKQFLVFESTTPIQQQQQQLKFQQAIRGSKKVRNVEGVTAQKKSGSNLMLAFLVENSLNFIVTNMNKQLERLLIFPCLLQFESWFMFEKETVLNFETQTVKVSFLEKQENRIEEYLRNAMKVRKRKRIGAIKSIEIVKEAKRILLSLSAAESSDALEREDFLKKLSYHLLLIKLNCSSSCTSAENIKVKEKHKVKSTMLKKANQILLLQSHFNWLQANALLRLAAVVLVSNRELLLPFHLKKLKDNIEILLYENEKGESFTTKKNNSGHKTRNRMLQESRSKNSQCKTNFI